MSATEMDQQRMRSSNYICQKWTLFSVNLIMLILCVILASMSKMIVENNKASTTTYDTDGRDMLESSLIAAAVISGLFSLVGLMGAWKEHYCSTVTFAVYMTLCTIASFYASIQASGLWVCAIFDLSVTVLAFSFARQLRMQRILRATPAFIITEARNQIVVVPIVTGLNPGQQSVAGPANQQWQPVQPPPYAQEYPAKQYP